MKRAVYLGGFKEFNPEDPNTKDGDIYLFHSKKDMKLHIGIFFKQDENGSWGFTDYFTGKRHYPYTSEVIDLNEATLEDVAITLNPTGNLSKC